MLRFWGMVLIGLACCAPAVQAEEDHKDELMQMMAVSDRAPVEAQVCQKLVDFKFSPAAWKAVTTPGNPALHNMTNLCGMVCTIATHMGWGDVKTLDRNSGYDGKSPLVADMIDSWKGKIHLTIVANLPDDASANKGLVAIAYMEAPFENDYNFHPRGGKAFITVTVNPKAAAQACKVSKDGNTYDVTVPLHTSFSQSTLDGSLQLGRAAR